MSAPAYPVLFAAIQRNLQYIFYTAIPEPPLQLWIANPLSEINGARKSRSRDRLFPCMVATHAKALAFSG